MPDGVNIPGGPSFAGTPQPPDVPCDPTGDGWRGPPGPAGVPGPPGPMPPGGPFLPLSGGTVSPGPLYIGTDSTGGLTTFQFTTVNHQNHTGALFLNRNGPTSASDDPQIGSYLAMTHTGGGVNPHVNFVTSASGNCSTWAVLNQSYFSSNNTSPEYGHVGFYSQQIRSGVNAGGTKGIGAWSGIFELRSQTGLPSSQDGILQTLELDLLANGADDSGTSRSVLSCVIGQNNTSGAPVEVGFGISFFLQQSNGSTGHYRNMIGAAAPFSQAVLQTNGATQMAGAHAIWFADGHHIAWNNAATALTYWDTTTIRFTAPLRMDSGIHFAGALGTSSDLSHHIDLYGGTTGFCVDASGTLNYLTATSAHNFFVAGAFAGQISPTGLNATPVGGTTRATGAFTTLSTTGAATLQGGSTISGGGSGWSSDNIGKQLLVTGVGNPGIGITDSAGANIYAIVNDFGQMIFSKMPALTDSGTAPVYLLALSPTLNSTGSIPWKFASTVGFNNTTPIAKPTVSGSKGANAALASLLTALAAYGLVTDSST